MTLLFDAYRSGRSDAVRKDIAGCLGRAFPSLHVQFPNEVEFVAAAEKWYKENQSKLQLNKSYPHLPSHPEGRIPASRELFILDKVDDGASAVKGPAT
jgi:hypothetical protein